MDMGVPNRVVTSGCSLIDRPFLILQNESKCMFRMQAMACAMGDGIKSSREPNW